MESIREDASFKSGNCSLLDFLLTDFLFHGFDLVHIDELALSTGHRGNFLEGFLGPLGGTVPNGVYLGPPFLALDDVHSLELVVGISVRHEIDYVGLGVHVKGPFEGIVPNRSEGKGSTIDRLDELFLVAK